MRTHGLLAAALLAGALAAPAGAQPVTTIDREARVRVDFAEPGRFTDVASGCVGAVPEVGAMLAELEEWLRETAEDELPARTSLAITITDVDLAGDFVPPRPPQPCGVRVLRPGEPPRIALRFRLTDDQGHVVREGTRVLTDPAYLTRTGLPLEDPLRYERALFRDWLRQEVGPPRS